MREDAWLTLALAAVGILELSQPAANARSTGFSYQPAPAYYPPRAATPAPRAPINSYRPSWAPQNTGNRGWYPNHSNYYSGPSGPHWRAANPGGNESFPARNSSLGAAPWQQRTTSLPPVPSVAPAPLARAPWSNQTATSTKPQTGIITAGPSPTVPSASTPAPVQRSAALPRTMSGTPVRLGNGDTAYVNAAGHYFDRNGNPLSYSTIAAAKSGTLSIYALAQAASEPASAAPASAAISRQGTQQTRAISPASTAPTQTPPAYTFQPGLYGMVNVFRNGQPFGTAPPQEAAAWYGYSGPATIPWTTAPALSANSPTPRASAPSPAPAYSAALPSYPPESWVPLAAQHSSAARSPGSSPLAVVGMKAVTLANGDVVYSSGGLDYFDRNGNILAPATIAGARAGAPSIYGATSPIALPIATPQPTAAYVSPGFFVNSNASSSASQRQTSPSTQNLSSRASANAPASNGVPVALGNGDVVYVTSNGSYVDRNGNPLSNATVARATPGAPSIYASSTQSPSTAQNQSNLASAFGLSSTPAYTPNMAIAGPTTPATLLPRTKSSVAAQLPLPAAPQSAVALTVPAAISEVSPGTNPASVYHNGYIYPAGMSTKPVPGNAHPVQQCAVLVQALVPSVGGTSSWRAQGPAVGLSNPTLAPGTPIATLENNRYPLSGYFDPSLGIQGEAHAAIFMGYIYKGNSIVGMNILDQYEGHSAEISPRLFANESYTYYPIH